MTNNVVNLVQRDGQKAFTTSLIVAEIFGKRHANVLRDIRARAEYKNSEVQRFNQLNFELVEFLDEKGEARPMYRMTHDGFAEIAMSYNGEKAMLLRVKFLQEFARLQDEITRLYANPPRTGLITDKRKSMWDMTDALKEIRADVGKETEAKHYMCENKLINWCITGKFAKLDEKSLTNSELEICKKLRVKNAAYIRADMEYAERKTKLKAYAERLRDIKLIS